jgi:DNA-binding transcriptional LysR family regulator
MELYQLKAFLAIARTGNLTRAAAEMHVSQPTLSGQLKMLEEELGVALFERTARGMKLTAVGQRLHDKAQDVVERATELVGLAASFVDDAAIRFRVGLNTTATALRVPQLVAALAEVAPRLRLELHHDQSHGILQDVSCGELDAGFFFGECALAGLRCSRLAAVELAVVGPSVWEAALSHASWQELLQQPWVLPPEICPFYAKTRELLLPQGTWPSDCVVADDEATTLDLVRSRAGVALLPTSMLEEGKGVSILRPFAAQIELGIAWQAGRSESHATRAVLQVLEGIWA